MHAVYGWCRSIPTKVAERAVRQSHFIGLSTGERVGDLMILSNTETNSFTIGGYFFLRLLIIMPSDVAQHLQQNKKCHFIVICCLHLHRMKF